MDRREFFRGAFGGVTAAGIILAGSTKDIELVADTKIGTPILAGVPSTPGEWLKPGDLLYNDRGYIVGVLESIDRNVIDVEVSSYSDEHRQYRHSRVDMSGRLTLLASGVFHG